MEQVKQTLSGVWKLFGTDASGNAIHIPVAVPGYVHPALEKAGLLPPVFWRDNAEKCQWPETREWVFEREFDVADDMDLTYARLEFGGVDTYADVLLNDVNVYQTKNMFLPFSVPVSAALKHGRNILRVAIHPCLLLAEGKPARNAAFNAGDRTYIRRVQCTFAWDWVNRFVSAGICRDVTLTFGNASRIESVAAATTAITRFSAAVTLQMNTERALENKNRFRSVSRIRMACASGSGPVGCILTGCFCRPALPSRSFGGRWAMGIIPCIP